MLKPTIHLLQELYNKTCTCRKYYDELEDLLNPLFHLDDCLYKIYIERENIEWKSE